MFWKLFSFYFLWKCVIFVPPPWCHNIGSSLQQQLLQIKLFNSRSRWTSFKEKKLNSRPELRPLSNSKMENGLRYASGPVQPAIPLHTLHTLLGWSFVADCLIDPHCLICRDTFFSLSSNFMKRNCLHPNVCFSLCYNSLLFIIKSSTIII